MTPDRVIAAARWGTGVFVVAAAAAAAWPGPLAWPSAVVALVLFALGCTAFVRALLLAAGRSRYEVLDLAGVFLLGKSAPSVVRRQLLGALAVQVVAALVTASVRPFTPLAFGVLAPVFGLGLCGLWGASAGTFPRRARVLRKE